MRILYNLGLAVYWSAVMLASLFSDKAKNRLKGSPDWKQKLAAIPSYKKRLWFHVSSYGEFEQGLPVFKKLRKEFPEHFIALTFFSPSGYKPFKNFEGADLVLYLPFDFPSNAKKFIEELRPELALFVKYEFWFNYLKYCYIKKVPVIYFSAIFRRNQYFFKRYGKGFLSDLKTIRRIFVQDEQSKNLLQEFGITAVDVIGDTRFDRVLEIQAEAKLFSEIRAFVGDGKLVTVGSSWAEDELLLKEWYEKFAKGKYKLLIAPHELSKERITSLIKLFPGAKKYSDGEYKLADVLVVDQIGILKHLYQYSSYNYVGGGFGKGIHNTLEPAVWKKPILFGPRFEKFNEAKQLIRLGLAISINDANSFEVGINKFQESSSSDLDSRFYQFFEENKGASDKVVEACKQTLNSASKS